MEIRRPLTLEEVARQAGVSKTTASVVLNGRAEQVRISESTRDRVMAVANELGYVPDHAARSLRRRRTGIISLLLWRLGSPFFSEIASGVGSVAGSRDYEVSVIDAHDLEAELRALQHLRQGSADGVIIAVNRRQAVGAAFDSLLLLAQRRLPVVILLDHSPHPSIPSIRVDDFDGGYIATRHLVGLGHRRIGHMTWDDVPLVTDEPDAGHGRFQGYRKALAEAGIEFVPSWVTAGPRGTNGGLELARRFVAAHPDPSTRPTAIFATNDLIAIAAMRGLHEAGLRVPDDIAMVGFHGVELGTLTIPALTTVVLGSTELGRLGAETLFDLLDGHEPADPERVLPVRLVVRESCGAQLAR
ncbi:MAG: LacI family DNA-binding transcriptional regulator [Chloroflexi bacterium]|nr:LacI family DNA-binding transcriptional regulator [Chloroflexota bacterium]